MNTDKQSIEALEARLNDPALYVDAIDEAIDVIKQLARERDDWKIKTESCCTAIDHLANSNAALRKLAETHKFLSLWF